MTAKSLTPSRGATRLSLFRFLPSAPPLLRVSPLLSAGLLLLLPALQAADDVIARVGESEIKAAQVRPYIENLSEQDRAALAKNPAALSQAVRSLILQQMLFKEAVAAGWEKNPEVVAQLERVRQGAISESYLQSVSKIPDSFPSAEEVKTVYEARKDELKVPKQIRLAQIFVAVPKDADKAAQDKAKARIEELAKAVKAGDFASVARDKSDARETAARGGEVGWLAESQLQPEIRTQVSGLAKGGVSEPVRLADGWYLLKALETKDAHTATLDEIKDQLATALRTDRARATREAYLAKLQQQNPVALDELGLAKLLQPRP